MCTCLGCISFIPNQLINSSNMVALVRKIPYICIDALLYISGKVVLVPFTSFLHLCLSLQYCMSHLFVADFTKIWWQFFNILYVASFTKHLHFSLVTTSLYYIEWHKILISKVGDVIFLCFVKTLIYSICCLLYLLSIFHFRLGLIEWLLWPSFAQPVLFVLSFVYWNVFYCCVLTAQTWLDLTWLEFSYTEKNAGKKRWWRNIICNETNISLSLVIIYLKI